MQLDYLSRKPFLDLLKSIIANQCNNPSGYSFAIDGEWGSGKTWILTELENQLAEDLEHKYLVFHYNAWENDFYDEPLVAILCVMIEKLNKVTSQKSLYNAAINELLKQASADLLSLVSGIVKEVTKINTEEMYAFFVFFRIFFLFLHFSCHFNIILNQLLKKGIYLEWLTSS